MLDAHGKCHAHAESAVGGVARREPAVQRLHPLAHAEQAEMICSRPAVRRHARAVILDRQSQDVCVRLAGFACRLRHGPGQSNLDARCRGVANHVGQAFLDDTINRDVEGFGKAVNVAGEAQCETRFRVLPAPRRHRIAEDVAQSQIVKFTGPQPADDAPFDVRTGACVEPEGQRGLERYAIKVEENQVKIGPRIAD